MPSTIISRLLLDHPDLGTAGGAGLHASMTTLYTKVGDHMDSRFFTENALANSASVDFQHNFKCAFDQLSFLLFLRDTGTGELTRITSATSPSISQFTIAATPSFLTTKTRVTNSSGSARDIAIVIMQDGGGAAGGGGGGSLTWNEPPGNAPIRDNENGEKVYLYEPGSANILVAFVKVPQSYLAGSQMNMRIALYSPSTSNTIKLKTLTYLVRKDTDAVSSTTNSYSSTNAALTNSGTANKYRETVLDLMSASGTINSVAVNAGDLLRIELSRDTDTDTADIRFIPNGTEVA